jgi:AcrR family transcriptional regulator
MLINYYLKMMTFENKMERIVRIPKQKRSIEKKNKIINAAYKIFNQKGFSETNTVEIAQLAGISIGSLYSYYNDKKDIFIETINNYGEKILSSIKSKFEEIPVGENIENIILNFMNINIESHNMSQRLHEEIMALSHLDQDIKNLFYMQRQRMIDEIIIQLKKRNISFESEQEKMLIIYLSIDAICNEFIFNKQSNCNKEKVLKECANLLAKLIINS